MSYRNAPFKLSWHRVFFVRNGFSEAALKFSFNQGDDIIDVIASRFFGLGRLGSANRFNYLFVLLEEHTCGVTNV